MNLPGRTLPWLARAAAVVLVVVLWTSAWPVAAQTAKDSAKPAVAAASTVGEEPEEVATKSLFEMIREGGLLMLPLAICSFVLMVFAFERTISLRRGRVIPGPFVKRFLHQLEEGQLDREQALLVCEENGSVVARVLGAAVKKWGRSAVEMEQAIIDAGERASNELRRYLRVFNVISTVGPLLGLLGTVLGMIQAFNTIAGSHAMGRPELLARGIGEALLATASGLLVAIPALLLYWYFVSRVDRLIINLDALGQDVVGLISAEAIQEASQTKRTRRPAA